MIELLKSLALTGGEWVIFLLIGCSILACAVIIERGTILVREKKELKRVQELFNGLQKGSLLEAGDLFSGIDGISGRILDSAFSHSAQGSDFLEEEISSLSSREKRRLETHLIILGTLGNNAVYIGLFGTVLGVIKAFHDLAEVQGGGPEIVMQGLSEALIATAVGLLVAIPSVISYNLFQKQIRDLTSETEAMVRLLLAQLKAEKKS